MRSASREHEIEKLGLRSIMSDELEQRGDFTSAWVFQANPSFRLADAVRELPVIQWAVIRLRSEIRKGHTAYLWLSGRKGGFLARRRILTDPFWQADHTHGLSEPPNSPVDGLDTFTTTYELPTYSATSRCPRTSRRRNRSRHSSGGTTGGYGGGVLQGRGGVSRSESCLDFKEEEPVGRSMLGMLP